MIDIIIPAYNAHKTIKRTLASIAMQKNIKEINVIIIDDASKKDYNKIYELFKNFMNIKLFRLNQNRGPGYARQYGINNSKSKYIIFMDSDDILYDYISVMNLKKCIEDGDCDVGVGNLVEYDNNSNETYQYTVGFDVLHSKIYKRKFLKENNIVFPEMYNSEDLSFNNLVIMCNPKINYTNENVYVYERAHNTLTMQEDYYRKKHIKFYVQNLKWTIKYAERNHYKQEQIAKIIVSSFAYLYYFFYNNFDDIQIKYIYELIPKYEEYEDKIDIYTKKELISFWMDRFNECPIEISYEDFIIFCKMQSKKLISMA